MEETLKSLRKFGDLLNTVCRVLLGVSSIALCFAVIGQFILRWFGMSMRWSSEFSCYIFVVTTMLGSALASRHLMHIGVDIVVNLLEGETRKTVLIAANIILMLVLALFVFASAKYTFQQIPHKGTTINVSLSLFYMWLPICGLVMMYYSFVQTVEIALYGEPAKILLPGDEEE